MGGGPIAGVGRRRTERAGPIGSRPRRVATRGGRGVLLLVTLAAGGCDRESAAMAAAIPGTARDGHDPGVALLFADGSGDLTSEEQAAIYRRLRLRFDPGRATLLLEPVCDAPVRAAVRFEDLNADGRLEVLVELGSLCLYGGIAAGTTLFVRDAAGGLSPNLGFPGRVVQILPWRRGGFRDLLIGGIGDCLAVWGWNGSAYDHVRNEPRSPGACDHLSG